MARRDAFKDGSPSRGNAFKGNASKDWRPRMLKESSLQGIAFRGCLLKGWRARVLEESLTDAFKGPFTFKKSIVFQHFASSLRPVFLEKLSLISLLKSDLKIHVFAFLTLSNIKLTFFKKKKNMVSFFSRYWEKTVSFSHVISLWGFWGGGPLGETPS